MENLRDEDSCRWKAQADVSLHCACIVNGENRGEAVSCTRLLRAVEHSLGLEDGCLKRE